MSLIKRSMKRDDIKAITKKRYRSLKIDDVFFSGIVSLLTIDEVSESVYSSTGHYKIIDKGYKWLQLAPFDDYYWLTVRIINDNIEDSYFDVTSKNHFDDLDDPWFEDLYLDIIIPYKEKPILVDEDELLKAYEDGLIDKGAYDKAYKAAHKIIDTYLEDQDSYYDHLYHYYHLLKDDD